MNATLCDFCGAARGNETKMGIFGGMRRVPASKWFPLTIGGREMEFCSLDCMRSALEFILAKATPEEKVNE